MTETESKILISLARTVALIARKLGVEETTPVEGSDRLVAQHLEAPMMALEEAGIESSPLHTGGGVYVLDVSTSSFGIWEDCYIWVTPEEETPGRWLVGGYEGGHDEGEFLHNVSIAGLYKAVVDMASSLVVYQIPGALMARPKLRGMEFTFVPAGGDAGYFGPHVVNVETGDAMSDDDLEGFWDDVANQLGGNAMLSIYWEG